MAVNKVIYGGETLVDLTSDTVTPETLAEGYTAHDKSGNAIVGTMQGGGGTSENVETCTLSLTEGGNLICVIYTTYINNTFTSVYIDLDDVDFEWYNVLLENIVKGTCVTVILAGRIVNTVTTGDVVISDRLTEYTYDYIYTIQVNSDSTVEMETA